MEAKPRPRVFISSVIDGYEAFRDAAADGITRTACQRLRAEDLPAGHSSPRNVCLDLVKSADAIVLILGSRYGHVVASGLSATEEEYDEARRAHKRVLAFLENVDEREPRQQRFVDQVQDYVGGHWRKKFSAVDELAELVEASLLEAQLSTDENSTHAALEKVSNALARRPEPYDQIVWLQLIWATLRDEEVLDPLCFDDDKFRRTVMRIGHECDPPLLDYSQRTEVSIEADCLRVQQGDRASWSEPRDLVEIELFTGGVLSISRNVTGARGTIGVGADYWEDAYFIDPALVAQRASGAWAFAAEVWSHVDAHLRHDPLIHQVFLHDVGTRRLQRVERSQYGGITVPRNCPHNPLSAFDEPRRISRSDLANSEDEVARALAMFRRRFLAWED